MLYLDLETRSQTDLIKNGLRRYAECETTEPICMAYGFDEGPIDFWWRGEKFPDDVLNYFNSGSPVMSHNSEFERHLFDYVLSNDYDFDPPALWQWRCSLTMALVSGYPAGLENLAIALGLKYQKNKHGTRLIKEYCTPGFLKDFKPGDRELMKEYCIYDVLAMREAVKCLRDLTPHEWAEFQLSCRINERGIPIDEEFALAALGYAEEVAADANNQISTLTNGTMVKATERKSRDAWLLPKLTEYQLNLLTVYKKGEKKISLDQDHRAYLLACDDLDPDAAQLLEYINDAGSSALKKYAVAAHQHIEGRIFNTFMFHGAPRTGRFSGKGIQPHNFRRDVYDADEAEELIDAVIADYEIPAPANTLARLLRGMVYHPDGLYYVDWKNIESRVAPWLARSASGEKKLDLFREGRDVYVVTAAEMFHTAESQVTDDERQGGKVAELSLQFGGGTNALIGMAKKLGVKFEQAEADDIVRKWRMLNPWAENIWREYDYAISLAVKNPGEKFAVGHVAFGTDEGNYLWCELPSDRLLAYPKPRWEPYATPWGEERIGATFQTHHKPAAGEPPLRNAMRGSLIFQNTVQAVAADILREALVEADNIGLHIVAHSHDEILGLGTEFGGDRLNELMLRNPKWADGLPLATSGAVCATRWGQK